MKLNFSRYGIPLTVLTDNATNLLVRSNGKADVSVRLAKDTIQNAIEEKPTSTRCYCCKETHPIRPTSDQHKE
ncbi:hypothetical protein J6590_063815 [Homalodisca vitripennis]|nr:hypothetical protein J6590_063815 [Homalodisca vitripennis]